MSKSSVMVFDLVTYSTDFVTDLVTLNFDLVTFSMDSITNLVTFSSPNRDDKFLCLVFSFNSSVFHVKVRVIDFKLREITQTVF